MSWALILLLLLPLLFRHAVTTTFMPVFSDLTSPTGAPRPPFSQYFLRLGSLGPYPCPAHTRWHREPQREKVGALGNLSLLLASLLSIWTPKVLTLFLGIFHASSSSESSSASTQVWFRSVRTLTSAPYCSTWLSNKWVYSTLMSSSTLIQR